MKKTNPPIIVEQHFESTRENVWSAITDLNRITQWFFDNIAEFKPVEGFETQFGVQSEGRTFTHLWKLITVIPTEKIVYSWRYQEYEGDATLAFELAEEQGGIKLSVICDTLEDFPDNVPEFKRESCIQGWNYFIKDRLLNCLSQ